jgi:RNA polymerase sigma factor (TIGR02999 family)
VRQSAAESLVDEASLAELVGRARQGDAAASSRLIDTVYPELRRLARHYLAGERREHTLQTTALVNEAWLRLFGASGIAVNDRAHLVALMATQMRRALVDHARHRNAAKGPGAGVRVTLDDAIGLGLRPDDDLVALDEALQALEAVDPRAAKVVELRFFGGFEEREAAEAIGISVATLKRDWVFARAWLYDRLSGGA